MWSPGILGATYAFAIHDEWADYPYPCPESLYVPKGGCIGERRVSPTVVSKRRKANQAARKARKR